VAIIVMVIIVISNLLKDRSRDGSSSSSYDSEAVQTAVSLPSPPPVQTQASTGRIVFVSGRDGNGEIYRMNVDGSNQVNLTNNPASDWHPRWSTDGTMIAFTSKRDGNAEIYVMDADGRNQTNLTKNLAPDMDPVWSPDGSKIAFISKRGEYPYGMFHMVYAMNTDGTQVTRIQDISIDQDTTYVTDWSPDGKYLAISQQAPLANVTLKLLEVKTKYTRSGAEIAFGGSFSPDGNLLAFTYMQDRNWEICIFDVRTGKIGGRLTNNAAGDWDPAWSTR
jgi:Tol biopolymer transport system component